LNLRVPGREELSREELLALLAAREVSQAAKNARIDALLVTVGELTAQVQALVLKLGKDSANSSRPPSSDGPGRHPRGGSSRKVSGRKPGKQPGDPGKALRLVDDPTERIGIPAPAACRCGMSLAEEQVVGVRRRQVHDLAPIPEPVVTEYAADVKCCPGCRGEVAGEFPAGVKAPAQYGPEITTRVADVVVGHHVPVHRSTILVMELLGMQVSTGFAAGLRGRAATLIRDGGFLDVVKELLACAPVVHADETFAHAAGGTAFVPVACTDHLTLMHTGDRSAKTIDEGGVLTKLDVWQVLVRDGYAGYTT
jgi:transposase